MSSLPPISLRLDGGFASLGSTFLTRLPAQALPNPYLVCASADALATLGFPADAPNQPAFVSQFAGAGGTTAGHDAPPETADLPFASVYSGHQFGNWAGQLGDGRAVSIGEVLVPGATNGADGTHGVDSPRRYELQLKGSGLTPYSRMGDGRAVLRSSIREFLCSEAMDALGIPTTRALCVIGSDLPVRRETVETAAIVTRFAPSFVRFGHFEHFWSTGQTEALRSLADHVIDRFYPTLRDAHHPEAGNPYLGLLSAAIQNTADLVAQWQSVGFCHGVMNTDNMSILGLTIDYGPFGFLDGFDAKHICNHTDVNGRYSYENQPRVAYWNLFCLAQGLLPLIAAPTPSTTAADATDEATDEAANEAAGEQAIEKAKSALAAFRPRYAARYSSLLRAKLGLRPLPEEGTGPRSATDEDEALFNGLFSLMQANRADFTLTFRRLAAISAQGAAYDDHTTPPARDLFIDREAFDGWVATYRARLAAEGIDDDARRAAMNRVNPKFVLRNHLAEVAIRAARDKDFSETARLLRVLRHPFDEQPENEAYAALPPDWASALEVSCSS